MAQPILFESNAFPGWPIWGDSERAALGEALESGNWAGSRAAAIATFGRKFAEFQGVGHGALMANGSVTLEAALIAAGIGEGDEVIVPALTFVATAGAVLRVNATPIIVDIDPQTLRNDPARVEEALTDRTRAVIAVHVAGMMADVDRLVPLCRSRSTPSLSSTSGAGPKSNACTVKGYSQALRLAGLGAVTLNKARDCGQSRSVFSSKPRAAANRAVEFGPRLWSAARDRRHGRLEVRRRRALRCR
jgi:DegT/DnrJ/EryC1/StrS aminotransferase family